MELKPVIIFGANQLGKSAYEIYESNGIVVYGFLDENKDLHGQEIGETTILGDPEDHGFIKLIGQKCDAFVASDEVKIKKDLTEKLIEVRKVMPANAIHNDVSIAKSSTIEYGNLINAGTRINAYVKIGSHNILGANSVVEVEAEVGNYCQIGAGSIINNGVQIEDEVFIGSGVTIVAGVKIGKGARIGAGSVVIEDVKENTTVFGNPAKRV